MTETQLPAVEIGPYPAATFAAGAVGQLPRVVQTIGARKIVLVSDRGLVATPLPEQAVQLLRQDGVAVEVFSGVHPNPTTGDVDAGGAFVRAAEAQAVISLGGGPLWTRRRRSRWPPSTTVRPPN